MKDTTLTSIFGLDLKVIYLFLDNNYNWLSLSDSAKMLSSNKMTVRRSLTGMVRNGLLEEKNDGYRRSFRLKKSHMIPELRRMKNIDSSLINAVIKALKGKVDALVLYGSRADGTNSQDSDWDILAISDMLDPLELNKINNMLEKRFGQVLNLHLYNSEQLIRMRNEKTPFYLEIVKKNVSLAGNLDDVR